MRWYSDENVDGIAVLRLAGDASMRRFHWLGGLDGLLMRGRRQLVISLEEVLIPRAADTGFLVVFARRIEDLGGDVVFVTPTDAHTAALLRQTGARRAFHFAPTVAAGLEQVQPARPPGSHVDGE